MGVHALLSPSGMPAAIRCLAKVRRERGLPEQSSSYADEGTAAHFLLEQCLLQEVDAKHFHGLRIKVENGNTEFHTSGAYPVGPDMTSDMQKALDYIRAVADGATIYAEQKLSIAHITGEHWHIHTGAVCFKNEAGEYVDIDTGEIYEGESVEPATGTTDVWIIKGSVAHSLDLKWGMGVQVYAKDNEQQEMYTDAGLEDFDVLGEVEEIHLHILQPRLKHYDEHILTRGELAEKIQTIREASHKIAFTPIDQLPAVPGDKQCRFCKISATCRERIGYTTELIVGEFVDLDKGFIKVEMPQAEKLLAQAFDVTPKAISFNETESREDGAYFLAHFTVKKPNIRPSLEAATERLTTAEDERLATLMDAADMIEGFAKAVRAEVERRLLAGKFTDARYKLVEGRQGARSWTSEEEAEAALKAMRLKVDQMYDFKLISPTTAEKVLKEANPRKWNKLQPLIGRSDGKPSVAPASDKRPALSMAIAEQFEELPAEVEQPVAEDNFDDLV
ncbi:hypothetical protein D3C85_622260 [compost metagenome]